MKRVLLFAFLVLSFTVVKSQTILYVNSSATGANNGTSWADAYTNLESAIVTSRTNTGNTYEIRIAGGTYTPTTQSFQFGLISTFAIDRGGLKIIGGYDPTTNKQNTITNPTILDGQYTEHVMIIGGIESNEDSLIINGLTITRGYANSSTAQHSTFGSLPMHSGAGIYVFSNAGSKINIQNCNFTNNESNSYGGAIYLEGASPNIINCNFSNNDSWVGGAIFSDANSANIIGCIFTNNTATNGSGIAVNNAVPNIANCIFLNNNIKNYSSSYTITNCIFSSGGIINDDSSPNITNSIFRTGTGINNTGTSSPVVTNCIVQSGYPGNINSDPQFVDASDPDGADNIWRTNDDGFALQISSPGVDAGSNTAVSTIVSKDIKGERRTLNITVDIGPYELLICPPNNYLYVDSNISTSGNGYSWGAAFKTLTEALDIANNCANIDSILIAKGTYYPTEIKNSTNRDISFTIKRNGLQLYGGYDAATGIRNAALYPTILSGDIYRGAGMDDYMDNSFNIMVIAGLQSSADSVVIDGINFTNGNALLGSNKEINGVAIQPGYGGGVQLKQNGFTKIVFRNCNFSDNHTTALGGAMYIESSIPLLYNCVFKDNVSNSAGGALYNGPSSRPILTHCIFQNNNATSGGGGAMQNASNASGDIINCVFTGNSANYGGALYNQSTNPTYIYNSTFAGNTATSNGGGLYSSFSSSIIFNNSIIWGNTASIGNNIYNGGSTINISNSLIQGSYTGTGNINADPLFVNAADADGTDNIWGTNDDGLKLQQGSPAINAGNNPTLPIGLTYDIANNYRIAEGTVDIGAYESNYSILPLRLLSFEGKRNNGINILIWKTASESNLKNFEVQRSTNANEFTTIATVKANNGIAQSYNYNDKIEFTGKLYYRIKINEADGKISYSKIVTLSDNKQSTINIFPNPAKSNISIVTEDIQLLNTEAVILNTQGKIVSKHIIRSINQPVNISSLPQGIYFIKFENGIIQKLIKE